MVSHRLVWADSLKGVLIILVVLGHAIQVVLGQGCFDNHLWNLIYSFHMAAFFAVSGWLAYKGVGITWGGLKMVCRKRCLQLLVPYVSWSIISFCISRVYSFHNFSAMLLYPDRYFWFLWVLFWICILFSLSRYLSAKVKMDELWGVAIASIIMLVVMIRFDFRMFGFQFLAYYFIFYVLGYCMHRLDFLQFSNKNVLMSLAVLWFLLAWSWNMHKLPNWFPENFPIPTTLVQYAYRGLTALIAVIVMLSIGPKLLNGTNLLNSYVSKLGAYSLGIYVCHLCFMGSLYKGINTLFPSFPIWLDVVILFTLSLVSTVFIVAILKRNCVTAKLLLGKQELS
mgnify:CR=1 FL=1